MIRTRYRSTWSPLSPLVLAVASLVAWCGCASQGGTISGIPTSTAEMRVVSNIPNTEFRYRIQRINAGPYEGWISGGEGTEVVLPLRTFTRYEVLAIAPGYEEKRHRFNESIPRYAFKFLTADRLPDYAQSSAPTSLSEPRPSTDPRPTTSATPTTTAPTNNSPTTTPSVRQPVDSLEPVELADVLFDSPSARNRDFGRYFALVIGNNDYVELPSLLTARGDAEAVAQLLRSQYGFEVSLLLDADRTRIFDELARIEALLGEKDNLLVYYAGHGYYDEDARRGYWLPIDARRSSKSSWVSNADITDSLRSLDAKHVMVVADSCYSGALTRGLNIRTRKQDYLDRLISKRARVVLSSGGLEPVADSGGNGHSVFANAFLTALRENTGVIDGHGLFSLVRRPVLVNSNQSPEYGDIRLSGHEGGDFLFVRSKHR